MAFDSIKYKLYWLLGTILSFILVYSGTVFLYLICRKKLLNKYQCVVLTYHRVRDDNIEPDISVNSNLFVKQMQYLKAQYQIVPLDEAMLCLDSNHDLSSDKVSITFDDGYRDNFKIAFPVLDELDITATVFLISGLIGRHDDFLDIEAIQSMADKGIRFGSHTVNHPILSSISDEKAKYEIVESKSSLESMLGEKVKHFAYPKGKPQHYTDNTVELVMKAGYEFAFTTTNGRIHQRQNKYLLPRIGIRNTPMFVFKARVSGIFESAPVLWLRKILKVT
jgi:peptidoglycan/xylan/chitin deacetylase (PgdA/CDA1 family)